MTVVVATNPKQQVISLLGLPGGTTVSYSGDPLSIGIGEPTLANFPPANFSNFLVMSSGKVADVTNSNASGSQGTDLGASGEAGDVATLILTIPVPKSKDGTLANGIGFDFTFLSEEFPEYVGSSFNDIFSVKLNGVEIAKDTTGKPISVNNNFFSSAFTPTGTFFDGQTPPLRISAALPAGATSITLGLQIADVGDGIYDSAAFVNNMSFSFKQIFYVDFDGGSADAGHGPYKGATVTTTALSPTIATPEFKTGILNTLNNTIFKDYQIEFKEMPAQKPAGEYGTILVGGAGSKALFPTVWEKNPTFFGIAEQIDVGNKDLSDLAVVLTENFLPSYPSGSATSFAHHLTKVIAHEAGHLLGLYHVDGVQMMKQGLTYALIVGDASQMTGKPAGLKQDASLELENSLGLKSGASLRSGEGLVAKTLEKQGVLGYNTNDSADTLDISQQVFDAQIAILSPVDSDDPPAFVSIGNLAPDAIKKMILLADANSTFVLMAKTSESGPYDIFSAPSAGALTPGFDLHDLGIKLSGGDTGNATFSLFQVLPGGAVQAFGNISSTVSQDPIYVKPLSVTDFQSLPKAEALADLVDFDGVNLGSAGDWKFKAEADVQGDGDKEFILFNQTLGRWATLGPDTKEIIDLASHSWGGDTRVVGIYIDPLVELGLVVKGSPNDSQARFMNDLKIDNIAEVLDAGDYNSDGFQEIYFSLTDKTAVLRAIMHVDGNIQYANYQNGQQLGQYMTDNGYSSSYYAGWLV